MINGNLHHLEQIPSKHIVIACNKNDFQSSQRCSTIQDECNKFVRAFEQVQNRKQVSFTYSCYISFIDWRLPNIGMYHYS